MKLVIISDTHMQHERVNLPDGDLLIHCGDATFQGKPTELEKVNAWFGRVASQYRHGIIFVPGNHELAFAPDSITNARVLINAAVEIGGKYFYGSPFTPAFCDWAFQLYTVAESEVCWAQIPDTTDVLITHGPPFGVLDKNSRGIPCGCPTLFRHVQRVKPALHCFGHIHEGYGAYQFNSTTYLNASLLDDHYLLVNKPAEVEIE